MPRRHSAATFQTEADYRDPVVRCLIRTGGNLDGCFDEADGVAPEAPLAEGAEPGWILWPLIPFAYDTVSYAVERAPSPPDWRFVEFFRVGDVGIGVPWPAAEFTHVLGTDDQARDVMARIIYGFRLSVLFGFSVTLVSGVIGVVAGAAQGFFGGWVDLFFQRVEEVWSSMNLLYVILIVVSVLTPTIWVMFVVFVAFGWVTLIGVVRAEFLRARNFEYVQAARALGVGDWVIMFRHLLPNAMVATVTMLPFMLTGSISLLAGLDFLGFGLGSGYPSLGELALQGKQHLQDSWLALAAFFTFAIMLSPDGLHVRGRARRFRPAEDVPVNRPADRRASRPPARPAARAGRAERCAGRRRRCWRSRDLSITFWTEDGVVEAVRHVSLEVGHGETLALVGESGSGKSLTALSTVSLLPDSAEVTGSVQWEGPPR